MPALLAILVSVSAIGAATTPGNVAFKAKWADWLRAHGAALLVNPIEQWYYGTKAPPPGGRPQSLNPVPPPASAGGHHRDPAVARSSHISPPSQVPLVVSPALPGEGRWTATGPLVAGQPGMYVAQFRADTVYTSQITTAVWIDPTRLRVRLVPGTLEPGGSWPMPPYLAGAGLSHAVAAFNGGFRLEDAHGGFYLDGRLAKPLQLGAASMVIYRDGRVDIGTWGRDLHTTPRVEAVLQNLVLLVDNRRAAPDASYHDTSIWGNTLGSSTVVARSGVGVTANGALVYVSGPALTAKTLAESLQRAGAIRAMTLDINPEWVTFNLYRHPNPAHADQVVATKLYPQMQRPATRYLGPTREARDFFTVSTN